MKTTLFALCFFCATVAFGQSGALGSAISAQPQVLEFTSHPQMATQQPMGVEQNIMVSSNFTFAQGERPLWEFSTPSHAISLGDSARMLKKEHEAAKKAEFIWNN